MASVSSRTLSLTLVLGTIVAGLVLRRVPLGLPGPLVKYGGSLLWAMMLYWLFATLRRATSPCHLAIAAGVLATAVECFKLVRNPALDAFRRTLPGALLLGRFFSLRDLVAYAAGLFLAALLDGFTRRGVTTV